MENWLEFDNLGTHTVVYRNLFTPTPEIEQFYTNANKASAVFVEFFLNLFGGIRENQLENCMYKLASKKENEEAERDDEEPEVKGDHPKEVILFTHWFSLEDKSGADPDLILKPQDVYPQFLSYLGRKVNDPRWADTLRAAALSAVNSDDRVWVDRRKGYNKLNADPKLLPWILKYKRFPLREKGGDEGQLYSGSLFSIFWGDGKKADFGDTANVVNKLRECVELPISEVKNACRKKLGISGDWPANVINTKILKKGGTPDGISLFLAGKRDKAIANGTFKIKHFIQLLDDKEKNASWRMAYPKSSKSTTDRFLNELEEKIGLPYEFRFYCEFAGKALQRITSNRKNTLNSHFARYNTITPPVVLPKWLEDAVEKWLKRGEKPQPFLTNKDIGDTRNIRECFHGSFVDAVKHTEKSCKNKRANFAFLKMVAELCDQNKAPLEILQDLDNYQKFKESQYDFIHRRVPRLARFTLAPDHPQYGKSRPNAQYLGTNKKKHKYTIEILTPEGKKTVQIESVNPRFSHDLINPDGTNPAPRRNKLTALSNEVPIDSIVPIFAQKKGRKILCQTIDEVEDPAVKLVKSKKGRYYLFASFELPKKPYKPLVAFANPSQRWRIGGFDPGIRKNITYSFAEFVRPQQGRFEAYIDQDGAEVIPVSESHWIKIIEKGVLKEQDFRRSEDNRHICRLESDAARATPKECQKVFSLFQKDGIIGKDEECPKILPDFISVAVGSLRRYVRENDRPSVDYYKAFVESLKNKTRNSGHLSYKRILNLKGIKSLTQAYLDEKKNPDDIPWLQKQLKYATNKVLNTRYDRIRRVPNLIAKKALEMQAVAVVGENNKLDIHKRAGKRLMSKIDIWTPRKVIEQCKAQLIPQGVYFHPEISDYSSHTDFLDAQPGKVDFTKAKARYDDLSEAQIRKELEFYEKIHLPQGTTVAYKNAITQWLTGATPTNIWP